MKLRRLCLVCLRNYKQSKLGKRQRALKREGKPCSWGRGHWPASLYHNGDSRVCFRHRQRTKANVERVYLDRDGVVRSLGFASYAAYLNSQIWKDIRDRTFAQWGSFCHFCSAPAAQVHHGRYDPDTMAGLILRHLYPVCGSCHQAGEFFVDGDKCTPKVATERMVRLAYEHRSGVGLRLREQQRKTSCV